MGTKPWTGRSEVSAFFQEHCGTKGLRGETVKRKPFSLLPEGGGEIKTFIWGLAVFMAVGGE